MATHLFCYFLGIAVGLALAASLSLGPTVSAITRAEAEAAYKSIGGAPWP